MNILQVFEVTYPKRPKDPNLWDLCLEREFDLGDIFLAFRAIHIELKLTI